jgi:hypothetical protein
MGYVSVHLGSVESNRLFIFPRTSTNTWTAGPDIYQLYDFETLLHWDLHTSEGDLTLDVFDMGTPENAFGMFSAESSPAYDYFPLGVAAYRNEGIINFANGMPFPRAKSTSRTAASTGSRRLRPRIGRSPCDGAPVSVAPARSTTSFSTLISLRPSSKPPALPRCRVPRYGTSRDGSARRRRLPHAVHTRPRLFVYPQLRARSLAHGRPVPLFQPHHARRCRWSPNPGLHARPSEPHEIPPTI